MRSRFVDQQPSRRGVLAAAAGAVALYPMSGCGLFGDDEKEARPPAPDPLAPLLAEARSLVAQHEVAITAFPVLAERLTPIAQAHREHVAALAKAIETLEPSASASASPTPPATGDAKSTLAALRAAEQKCQKTAAQACQAAPPERAALLGSIAAACATHLEVVR